ncbi:MAG: hypothetical protein EZS28_008166 [Streblomastix strix]|uniref:Uncharacterized protein n=1 Tax=Streblomastix strix TaxID=222440 RepID=A0A5J4WMU4_9EUKA|nr:MAG: hypothetical protein EZS28_008166 [Streblomastix strix]
MGFFFGIANFGSKIIGGVKKAAQCVVPALCKVLSTISGPVEMIHPAIGGALGAGANLAGAVDRLKRGNSGQSLLSNDEYQLFIDNEGALIYTANNLIVDGMATDFALKIDPLGLLTIKNLKVINFDFVNQIVQLDNEMNQFQASVGSFEGNISDIQQDVVVIQQELVRQQHFRGYYLTIYKTYNLPNAADGDYAYSAEDLQEYIYDSSSHHLIKWIQSEHTVPDQLAPASDSLPLVDGIAAAGISNEYSRGDHRHPDNVSTTIPEKDSSTGNVGTKTTYARSDHQHPLQFSSNNPVTDSASGSYGSTTDYALSNHSHPINVETNARNIPKPDGQGDNYTSTFYARNDHIHPLSVSVLDPLPDGEATAGVANTYARSDHVHPINVSSDVPIKDTSNRVVGINTTFSRSDHAHPLNVTIAIPIKCSSTVVIAGIQNTYARIDHQHPLQISTTSIPVADAGSGLVGNSICYASAAYAHPFQVTSVYPLPDIDGTGTARNSSFYARSNHAHPINVYPNNGSLPKPNFNPSNGTSPYYSRHDHVHLLTVTFLENLTAPGQVGSGVSDLQVLRSDGKSKPLSDFMLV